ncbi:hypothetical protein BDB00DRAFT_143749 [Zychaea mexicana]|uniref:uncharacterized protein n=1 Tax=Zychaea mexicana TaxID=64656 RepID=UPI0022FE2EAA|nr:uncharacterized protein BDB00DRAFT_143749 [Zychaea mexicana]KAI9496347.1 hypothetical protein BDB00DRAFT_143749 [Zychaea mexicana]
MNQGMYPGEPYFRDQDIHATHSYTRKFCGCMSLQGGGILACLIWLGINLYVTILSFQSRSPVFSYLDYHALMVTGSICIIFLVAALFAMFALVTNKPAILRLAHRSMWVVVFIFVINFFIDIILFGVQRPQFNDWCVSSSRELLGSSVNSTAVEEPQDDSNLYNCNKLWEDELKFAIVLFIMITICYMYWALCLWSYTQKQLYFLTLPFYPPGGHFGPGAGPAAAAGGMPPPATMMNLKPKKHNSADDEERGTKGRSMTARPGAWISSLFSRMSFSRKV